MMSRPACRPLSALAALITLVVLVAGLPVALYLLGGDPFPHHLPGWHAVGSGLLQRDTGAVFLGLVRDIAWLAWAAFTAAVLAESYALLRGRAAPRLRLLGLQNAAGWLVAFAAMSFGGPSAALLTAAPVAAAVAPQARQANTAGHARGGAGQPDAVAAAESPADRARPATARFTEVTVQPGDCLWTIAEHYLGSGERYIEIARLNLGREMGDGQVFTDPSLIEAGWVLRLPAAAASPQHGHGPGPQPGPAADPAGHTRHAGHSAQDSRYATPHAAAGAPQASHAHVSQAPTADLGRAGRSPSAAGPAPAAPAPASHVASGARAVPPAQQGRARAAAPQQGQWPPAAVFAAGMVAGGAAVTLARMRHRQRQHRRLGRRIPLPASAPVLTAEQQLRASGAEAEFAPFWCGEDDLAGDAAIAAAWDAEMATAGDAAAPPMAPRDVRPGSVTRPASALRAALAQLGSGLLTAGRPVPEITGVRVSQAGLEILLASPASDPPPVPFEVAAGRLGMTWQLTGPARLTSGPAIAATGDLLPGLMTAGLTADGAFLLVDLEYLRVLTVDGPAGLADQVLATAATELSTSELAGWYDLILVGFPELAAVNGRGTVTGSLDEALDLLAAKAVVLRRRLGPSPGPGEVRLRRLSQPGDEDWGLTLLVSRVRPNESQLALMLDLASEPGGVAVLVPGGTPVPPGHPAPASFRLAADPDRPGGITATIEPAGYTVSPQPLSVTEYDTLTSLFSSAAELDDVPADTPPYDGSCWPSGAAEPEPRAGEPVSIEDEPPGAPSAATNALRIGVLGTFTINGAPAVMQPAQSALVLALALHGGDGLSNAQLCYLLGADPDHPKPTDSLRQLIVRTRRQLGKAPDGREWIEHLGGGQYALHPLASFDWTEFDAMAEQGIRNQDAVLLRNALAMVRGQPFTGCYYWWLDLALTETVRAQIVDAGEMLSALELADGDAAAAARAARAGLAADVCAEQLWRALMRAEDAAGNSAGVREAWARCLEAIADVAPDGEPHPDTTALYHQLVGVPRGRPAWARP
jgi:DNA-binding SARP family transcriptional activator